MGKPTLGDVVAQASAELIRQEPMTYAGASARVMTMTYDEAVAVIEKASTVKTDKPAGIAPSVRENPVQNVRAGADESK